jgi:sec-independent protein translocase protein TatB
MFDVGFSEVLVIGVVALLVLGPEKLPQAARTVGALLRKIKQSWHGVRAEFEREIGAEDIQKSTQWYKKTVDSLSTQVDNVESSSTKDSLYPRPGEAPNPDRAPHD